MPKYNEQNTQIEHVNVSKAASESGAKPDNMH